MDFDEYFSPASVRTHLLERGSCKALSSWTRWSLSKASRESESAERPRSKKARQRSGTCKGEEIRNATVPAGKSARRNRVRTLEQTKLLSDHLRRKKAQCQEDTRLRDTDPLLHDEPRPDPRTQHVRRTAGKRQKKKHFAIQGENDNGGDIGREIQHFRMRIGTNDAHTRHKSEGDGQKGATTWTIEPIVSAYCKSRQYAQ